MKRSTIVVVAFMAVLAAGWLGMTIGVRIGTDHGRAEYNNQYVRALQDDLGDASQKSKPHIQKILEHVSDLVATMGHPEKFRKAHEVFAEGIEELQSDTQLGNPSLVALKSMFSATTTSTLDSTVAPR